MLIKENVYLALYEIALEYENAVGIYGKFNSPHEAYSIILEEVDELWHEIKKRKKNRTKMRNEAKQIAAMALRFMVELADD